MHVGYSVWSIWSVLVLFMPRSVYGLSPADKLLLGATATLVGGCLRIPYAVAVAKFGGRGVQDDPCRFRGTQPPNEHRGSRTPPLGPCYVRCRDRRRGRDRHARRLLHQYGSAAVLPEHRIGDDGILLLLVVLAPRVGADVVDVCAALCCRQADCRGRPSRRRCVRAAPGCVQGSCP
jgi:hypothetical protein